jgi:hypothetical protein
MSFKLLEGAGSVQDGPWKSINEISRGKAIQSVEVKGITTATVTLEVSNENPPPGAGNEILNVTADALNDISGDYLFYRARVTAWTAGSIDVILQ